jgi:hypothetical protein
MKFLNPLDVRVVDREDHPDGKTGYFEVLNDFTFEGAKYTITVPAGTLIDFASIPRILRWLFNRFGPSRKAAAIHDYLYQIQFGTRKLCDELFREALEARGVNKIVRNTYKLGVRSGGWTRGSW